MSVLHRRMDGGSHQSASEALVSRSTGPIPSSYQQLPAQEHDETILPTDGNRIAARKTLLNFALMSILFSANHGCVVGAYGLDPCCRSFRNDTKVLFLSHDVLSQLV